MTGLHPDAFAEALAAARLAHAGLAPEPLSQPGRVVVAAGAPLVGSGTPPAAPCEHRILNGAGQCIRCGNCLTVDTRPPPSTLAEIGQALARYENSRPRSVQTTLGPSELGTPCDRQIGMKLAGVERHERGLPWAPMCGTAVHGLMEQVLEAENARLGRERWIIEQKVQLDDELSGHGDAFDTDWGMVVDWKYTGTTARRKASRRNVPNEQLVSAEYRTQAHLYGLGHSNSGRSVQFVRLVLLARSHDFGESVEWTEEYREDIALGAMTRFYAIRDKVINLDAARLPERLAWIEATPGDACKWCPFHQAHTVSGLEVDASGCRGRQTASDEWLATLPPTGKENT